MKELQMLWEKDEAFINKNIEQILVWIGNINEEEKKEELRSFFKLIPLEQIKKYLYECINSKFADKGFVFQDLVNELGIRLGNDVSFGRYKGKKGENGYDGLWKSKSGHVFIVESKTTDNFSLDLERLNTYRQKLINSGEVSEKDSSILLVVGQKETNTIVNTITGSKYKWNMSVIGVDSLLKIVEKRDKEDDVEIYDKQISNILKLEENVDMDKLIEITFPEKQKELRKSSKTFNFRSTKKRKENVNFYIECMSEINKEKKIHLSKKVGSSKVLYEDKLKHIGVIIIISNITKKETYDSFWFAYHDHYKEYMKQYKEKYIALGCGSKEDILLLPIHIMDQNIDKMGFSNKKNKVHWHVYVKKEGKDKFYMNTPRGEQKWIDISKYHI